MVGFGQRRILGAASIKIQGIFGQKCPESLLKLPPKFVVDQNRPYHFTEQVFSLSISSFILYTTRCSELYPWVDLTSNSEVAQGLDGVFGGKQENISRQKWRHDQAGIKMTSPCKQFEFDVQSSLFDKIKKHYFTCKSVQQMAQSLEDFLAMKW